MSWWQPGANTYRHTGWSHPAWKPMQTPTDAGEAIGTGSESPSQPVAAAHSEGEIEEEEEGWEWSRWCQENPLPSAHPTQTWQYWADGNEEPASASSGNSADFDPMNGPFPCWEGGPPTPSKGAEEDFRGLGFEQCAVCRKVIRGGRWALRQHQFASSFCLAARTGAPAREPCSQCGKMIAAGDDWASKQHSKYCPGQQSEPPAHPTWLDGDGGEYWDWQDRSPQPSDSSREATEPSGHDVRPRAEPSRKQRKRPASPSRSPIKKSRRSHDEALPQNRKQGAICKHCGHLVKGTGHPVGDAAAMDAHMKNSSKCLAARGLRPGKDECPHCGKLLASGDGWAREQHSWHCRRRWG